MLLNDFYNGRVAIRVGTRVNWEILREICRQYYYEETYKKRCCYTHYDPSFPFFIFENKGNGVNRINAYKSTYKRVAELTVLEVPDAIKRIKEEVKKLGSGTILISDNGDTVVIERMTNSDSGAFSGRNMKTGNKGYYSIYEYRLFGE